jgi:ribosomal protein S15
MKKAGKKKKKKHADPYRLAQARQRRAANVARQSLLYQDRVAAMGDPVRSRPTPFVESLNPKASVDTIKQSYLNYFVKPGQLKQSIEQSKDLVQPMLDDSDPQWNAEEEEKFSSEHENAVKAMAAIASLDNASGKDRLRVNVQRCIEEFGRHNTDAVLPPKPPSLQRATSELQGFTIPARAGPDTGSSEVQVGILTAKINVLVENLSKKDKHNKRNLRLLVHRRQKLLAYLRRKERGGPRWQHLVEKLGINDAMWQGEISLP